MNPVFEWYLDPAFVYRFDCGPDEIRTRDQALRRGLNCISLAHLVLRDLFNYVLPPELGCYEMYINRKYFSEVESSTELVEGDLVWLGLQDPELAVADFEPQYLDGQLANWFEFPVKHVAICIGEKQDQDPLLLHSTFVEGTNAIWPITKFADYRRYQKLYGTTRLIARSD